MKKSELLKHAAALREQSTFREAYDAFLSAADKTDNVLEKSAILLDVVTNLTMLGEYDASRRQLKVIKEMLSGLDPKHLTQTDQNEFLRVLVGIDVEHAEILAADGNIEGAIEKLAATVENFRLQLEDPEFIRIYDDLQCRRAYFLADIDLFNKAIPILEEVENRHDDDSIFLFYLGQCYFRAKLLDKAQRKLERAINLATRQGIAFQAYAILGMVLYEVGDYARAKKELETSASLATPQYIKDAKIWKWLEYACRKLGLQDEARQYALLANPS